ncbi:uncharacterized protein LOC106398003 isoform X2 [Brassica napus]|uniref:uncharacterized protein LOC106398003 isoform X2 n=1 Tax=Brassica napus TaxID=3708 RepID=UPI0006AB4D18|nr:uncharacterized protein LOC106398003 isoform X2 [Brassica napus]
MSFLRKKPASLVFIGDIDPAKDCYKIKVKVIKLWNTWKNSKIVSIELVLADINGTRIHASIDERSLDVIGEVVNVGPLENLMAKGKSSTKLELTIRDINDTRLTCTLWSGYAKQVSDFFKSNEAACIVCVARFVCVREFRGVVTVSNVFNATEILFDPQLPEVLDFKSKLPNDDLIITREAFDPKSTPLKVDLYDEFFIKNPIKSIRALNASNEVGKCVTLCKIVSIETTPKWYFVACGTCRTTVHPCEDDLDDDSPPLFHCSGCNGNVSNVVARFKLVLCVTDHTGEAARFILFDNVVVPFLHNTAMDLAEEVAEENASVLPLSLVRLIGKTYIYKINVSADNLRSRKTTFKVDIISDDEDLISKWVSEGYTGQGGLFMDCQRSLEDSAEASQSDGLKRNGDAFDRGNLVVGKDGNPKKLKKNTE